MHATAQNPACMQSASDWPCIGPHGARAHIASSNSPSTFATSLHWAPPCPQEPREGNPGTCALQRLEVCMHACMPRACLQGHSDLCTPEPRSARSPQEYVTPAPPCMHACIHACRQPRQSDPNRGKHTPPRRDRDALSLVLGTTVWRHACTPECVEKAKSPRTPQTGCIQEGSPKHPKPSERLKACMPPCMHACMRSHTATRTHQGSMPPAWSPTRSPAEGIAKPCA